MVNVLISTTQSQGDRPDDFCWVPEGELVARYGMPHQHAVCMQ